MRCDFYPSGFQDNVNVDGNRRCKNEATWAFIPLGGQLLKEREESEEIIPITLCEDCLKLAFNHWIGYCKRPEFAVVKSTNKKVIEAVIKKAFGVVK